MLLQGRDTSIDSIFRAVTEVKIQVKSKQKIWQVKGQTV